MQSAAASPRAKRDSPGASQPRSRSLRAKVPRRTLGMAYRLPLRDAAVVNGALMHGLDYDDTHAAGVIHLTVSTFPAALGTAAHSGAAGAELLAAYIAGVETGAASRRGEKRLSPGRLSPDRRGRRLCREPRRGPPDEALASAPGRRAGHRALARERQPAVHRGRLLDQAHPSRLGRGLRHQRRFARGGRFPGAA